MKYPSFLKENGTIGFIAPSYGCARPADIAQFDAALGVLEGLGYKTAEGPNTRLSLGIGRSNTAEECAKEVNDFFINDKCDVIFSCSGGELMCEDLPFIDFDGIKKATPKWYMGYSDNTNLTFTLPTLCDIAAIYGSGIKSYGQLPWHKSMQDQLDLIKGEKLSFENYDGFESTRSNPGETTGPDAMNYNAPIQITDPYKQIIYAGNKESESVSFGGRAIGGCLDCLVALCGTRFDKVKEFIKKYQDDGIVWFLESCELNPFSERRALWQLENAGWFENAKGFVFGRPLFYRDEKDFSHCDAITGILGKYNVPIIMEADIGHLPPRIPYVAGAVCNIAAKENTFKINFELR